MQLVFGFQADGIADMLQKVLDNQDQILLELAALRGVARGRAGPATDEDARVVDGKRKLARRAK
jgi:hypothetical protein